MRYVPSRASIFAGAVVMALGSVSHAQPQHIDLTSIAASKVWQHLIFWRQGQAEVRSEGFYLSASPTPLRELDATLSAFEQDIEAKCRYPARYYWLAQQTELGLDPHALTMCRGLPDPKQDIRMILVSGYLKNPASTFGHVLISSQATHSERLLADSYNFGAQVPNDENSLTYVFKGLFGFYQAAFAKADFFKQDAMYSKTEQRDMWEYVLNLSPDQKAIINYHLYEARRQRFDYYFIKQNCAYRSGELLELIDGLSMTARQMPWYAPDFIFHQLEEHHQDQPQLIERVIYHPSEQSKLYGSFARLDQTLQQQINRAIVQQQLEPITSLQVSAQIQALDFLLQYINFQLVVDPSNAQHKSFKKELIRRRFELPLTPNQLIAQMADRPSPATGPKPSRLELQIGEYPQLKVGLFQRDFLNTATDINAEFRMIDIAFNLDHTQPKIAHADLIKMRKFEDLGQTLVGEKRLSWEVNAGIQPDAYNQEPNQWYARGGVGGAYQINPHTWVYQLLSLEAHDQHSHVDGISSSGLIYKQQDFAVQLEHRSRWRDHAGTLQQTELTLRQGLSKNQDIRLHWLQQSDAQVRLGYSWYW